MKKRKRILVAVLCVMVGFVGVMAYQGYSSSIQAGKTHTAVRKKRTPSPTYAPIRNAAMVVKSRKYVKKIKNANKEVHAIRRSLKNNKRKIRSLKKHRREAKQIMNQGEDVVSDDLKKYTEKYNAFEYQNNVGYSMYADLQQDNATKEETMLGSALQTMALSMGDDAVSDMLAQDVQDVTAEIALKRETVKEKRKELRAIRKKKKRVAKYVNIVYKSSDIFTPSHVDKKSLQYALAGTEMASLADAFLQAEERYGVNAIALAGIAAHESAWGSSRRARYDNNLTGFGVYSDSAVGINGRTKTANILQTARCLANRYAKPGQSYYHGKGLPGVNRCYAASRTWAQRVEDCSVTMMEKIAEYNRR